MAKKDCTTCAYASFKKDSRGHRQLEYGGVCGVGVALPFSYRNHIRYKQQTPEPTQINKFTPEGCPHWEKKNKFIDPAGKELK